MLTTVLVVALALGLSCFTYLWLERLGRRAWIPLLFRALGWTALGLLVVNLTCAVRSPAHRPLVLLDASLSLSAPGGRWDEARDSAGRWGEIRDFGDERAGADSLPTRGRSLLAPSLLAASASDRPIIVISDGEIEDVPEIPADILARSGVRLFPRDRHPDWSIMRVTGARRVTAGDSIRLDVVIQPPPDTKRDTATVQVSTNGTGLARRRVRLRVEGEDRARIVIPTARLKPGDHVLQVSLLGNQDPEPRTDTRLHIVTVAATPGVVLLAGAADWDSRFLYRTIREVSQLPVRGYVKLEGSRWRSMSDLRPVSLDQVRRAARGADLLVLKGPVGGAAGGSRARGLWTWISGETGQTQPGDWYLLAPGDSPLSGAFLGQPLDSFPPAIDLTPGEPDRGTWESLSAQLGRRGLQRPAVYGKQDGRVRRVTVAVNGLWRWAFRGGASEQSYRSWVSATTSWLLGGADSTQGQARPVQPVVANGRPIVFEWVGAGQPSPLALTWSGDSARGDTLFFDGDGRATIWRSPGVYRYRLASGGEGTVAVEQYSDELLPRTVTLAPHEPRLLRPRGSTAARDWLWLFGLCILAFSGEWLARRRLGLR
ncbi:MAG: hypothetical protein ACJ8AP_00410 [Gemmatimonadales bacterium]